MRSVGRSGASSKLHQYCPIRRCAAAQKKLESDSSAGIGHFSLRKKSRRATPRLHCLVGRAAHPPSQSRASPRLNIRPQWNNAEAPRIEHSFSLFLFLCVCVSLGSFSPTPLESRKPSSSPEPSRAPYVTYDLARQGSVTECRRFPRNNQQLGSLMFVVRCSLFL